MNKNNNNKFKIPTCNCEICTLDNEIHSNNLIIPTVLPKELEGILTFEEYKLIVLKFKCIFNNQEKAFKFITILFFIACLISLIFIKFHSKLILILILILIISIIIIAISIYYYLNKSIQPLLDKQIQLFNIQYKSKGIKFEKCTKQYSNQINDNNTNTTTTPTLTPTPEEPSKYVFIYIYYNINIDSDNGSQSDITLDNNNSSNEIITHKFQHHEIEINEDNYNNNNNNSAILTSNNINQSTPQQFKLNDNLPLIY